MVNFHGIIPPVVTLFDEAGNLDLPLNRRYMDKMIDSGVDGLLLTGSSGEFSSLSNEERKLYVREMIKHINGRVPVMVGIGHTSLKDVIDLAHYAEERGADGLLAVAPFYWNLTDDQLVRFFETVASETSLPVFIYNVPLLTGQTLSVDVIKRIAAAHPNIAGMKETIADIGHIRQVIQTVKQDHPDFRVFSAFDEHMLPALMIGADGSINGSAVFAPETSVQLYAAYQQGDLAQAEQHHKTISRLMDIYALHPAFFIAMKEAVHARWFSEKPAGHRAPFDVFPKEVAAQAAALIDFISPKEGVQS